LNQPLASNSSQFTLRALFAVVALFAIVFALLRYGGGAAAMVVITFGALIAAHVVGNSLGTRLRDDVSREMNPRPAHLPQRVPSTPVPIDRRLHERTPIGRVILITTGGAAFTAAVLGGAALFLWTSAGPSGWLVGTLSSAVVGGFVGFLLASFLEMTIRAWWQAARRQ
jgi:hypothetical protein